MPMAQTPEGRGQRINKLTNRAQTRSKIPITAESKTTVAKTTFVEAHSSGNDDHET